MMIKHFCDNCGVEITRENQFDYKEVQVGKHTIGLEVKKPYPEEDAICKYCVIDAIKRLDDRPTAA